MSWDVGQLFRAAGGPPRARSEFVPLRVPFCTINRQPTPAAAHARPGTDPNRCDRGFVGNTIGQANAVSNKPLDLRYCKYAGANLSGKTLSGGCWDRW